MSYSHACKLLGFTTPKSLAENARLAASCLQAMTPRCPLRFAVACKVLIDAAK